MVPGQSFEYTLDITTLLHGDDSKLILFVDPDKECFGCVVEDTTALWPVTLHTSYLQVWISRHEEEVIIDQLLSDLLVHASQWVVVSGKITLNHIKLLIFILKLILFHRHIKQWKEPAYDKRNSTINQYVSCIISISLGLGSHNLNVNMIDMIKVSTI